MDLVNTVYKYINRFINSEELIKILKDLDRETFNNDEVKEIDELIRKIEEIIKTIPIEVDEIEKHRMAALNRIIESIEKALKANKLEKEEHDFLKDRYDSLLEEKKIKRDSGQRYDNISKLLTNSKIYKTYCQKMNDLELLKFIAQYISVPMPPKISQETFNDLVKAGIKEDKREALWRLAANYYTHNKDLSLIENYFIDKRDAYYLTEFISVTNEVLDKNQLIEKIGETHDLNFYKEIIHQGNYLKEVFNKEQKKRINEIIRKEEKHETI